MEQKGYVTSFTNDGVKVRVDRESSCGGNCVSCKGCPSEAVIIELKTNEAFEIGEEVILSMSDKSFFKNVFLGYGVLIILAIVGAVLGYNIFKSEGASVLGTFIGIAAGLTAVKPVKGSNNNGITLKRKG